ncbi:MAG: uracil-DNA glycosylase [Anaerolineae bacterium]|nr:uracil-DNA glycosylase [Anaerolineae bacterium]
MQTWIQQVPLMQRGYHQELMAKVTAMRANATIYPPADRVFYALEITPFDKVQVVLVGQDPYHGVGQANGLAFSVPAGITAPPSLRNIFKEIQTDVYPGSPQKFSNDLTRWAQQGVLLLNASLTVEAQKPASHKDLGWQKLTDQIIERLNLGREHLVFMLWGRHAQAKRDRIDPKRHLVLEAAHPSPLSANHGFFGCKHFSKANAYLAANGGTPIVW